MSELPRQSEDELELTGIDAECREALMWNGTCRGDPSFRSNRVGNVDTERHGRRAPVAFEGEAERRCRHDD